MLTREHITERFMRIQDSICTAMEQMDGSAVFHEDKWDREGGGGGRTRVLQDGKAIEKGCVNFSAVHGKLPALLYKELKRDEKEDLSFYATGVSIVMHPQNPHVPIIHMNVRYFEVNDASGPLLSWFGGGMDLTPHYIVKEDAAYFHAQLKNICDKHDPSYYAEFKKWADDYFFIAHRNETRGIGGIFFDKLSVDKGHSPEQRFAFVCELAESFAPTYSYLVNKSKVLPFTEAQKQWQLLRRGRYVEFNLVYDRGTRFGLETNGRAESILLSLPKKAAWEYDHKPLPGSAEESTLLMLKKDLDWTLKS